MKNQTLDTCSLVHILEYIHDVFLKIPGINITRLLVATSLEICEFFFGSCDVCT
jgi:hypothetical protein